MSVGFLLRLPFKKKVLEYIIKYVSLLYQTKQISGQDKMNGYGKQRQNN